MSYTYFKYLGFFKDESTCTDANNNDTIENDNVFGKRIIELDHFESDETGFCFLQESIAACFLLNMNVLL